MSDQTTSVIVVAADADEVMAVISDFDSYPSWAESVRDIEVVERDDDGRATKVRFVIDAGPIRDEYTLAYTWGTSEVRWHLVESKFLKAMDGAYVLDDRGDGTTEVTYRLAVDITMPMIGMLRRKAERVIIDTALKGLRERVESGG